METNIGRAVVRRAVVRRAVEADLDAAASVLADAFDDYPWTRWTVDADDHRNRVEGLQRLALETFGLSFGEVWVAEVDDRIATVAAWNDSRAIEPARIPSTFASTVRSLEGDRHEASLAASRLIDPLRPAGPQLFLGVVGTDRSMQGRGLATRTLEPLFVASDAKRLPIVLETSSEANVAFYERLGFVTLALATLPNGGPDVWVMERPVGTGSSPAPG